MLNKIILIIFFWLLIPRVSAQPSPQEELAIMSKRCNYYYLRARAGDHSSRAILLTRNPQEQDITGYEKCSNIISEYLQTPNISPEEKNFYEHLNQNLATIIKLIPEPEKPKKNLPESQPETNNNSSEENLSIDNLPTHNSANDNNIIKITPNSRMEIILTE
jgi:hypothetical protein